MPEFTPILPPAMQWNLHPTVITTHSSLFVNKKPSPIKRPHSSGLLLYSNVVYRATSSQYCSNKNRKLIYTTLTFYSAPQTYTNKSGAHACVLHNKGVNIPPTPIEHGKTKLLLSGPKPHGCFGESDQQSINFALLFVAKRCSAFWCKQSNSNCG